MTCSRLNEKHDTKDIVVDEREHTREMLLMKGSNNTRAILLMKENILEKCGWGKGTLESRDI